MTRVVANLLFWAGILPLTGRAPCPIPLRGLATVSVTVRTRDSHPSRALYKVYSFWNRDCMRDYSDHFNGGLAAKRIPFGEYFYVVGHAWAQKPVLTALNGKITVTGPAVRIDLIQPEAVGAGPDGHEFIDDYYFPPPKP